MSDDVSITLRVSVDLKERLDSLARTTKRSRSALAVDALQQLVDQDKDDIEHIRQALEATHQPDARFVPHDQAMAWIRSRSTSAPLPKPKGQRRRRG
jgi:predicted transcriptional regulator